MLNYFEKKNRPFVEIRYLLLLALVGALLATILSFAVGFIIYGKEVLILSGSEQIGFLKLAQVASTLGIFLIPAWVYARTQSNNALTFLKLNTTVKGLFFLLVMVIMVVFGPLLEWTIAINKQMVLPDFLQGLENWMKDQEAALEKLTMQLLRMESPVDLAINLLMIAILPAIGEELIFRGCLQKIMIRWTKNYHWGIWIAAIVFSAIHVQFYGFLPRMLLGALFGYLLVWGKSIWLPILAHFINNGTAVVAAYVYQKNGQSIEKINEMPYETNAILYVGSLILTGMLLWVFYKQAHQYEGVNKSDADRLG